MPLSLGNTRGWGHFYGGIYTVMSRKEKSKNDFRKIENGGNSWFYYGSDTYYRFSYYV